jgi:hypothetical protein
VRPSGTEDCVRVYAEATTREAADGALPAALHRPTQPFNLFLQSLRFDQPPFGIRRLERVPVENLRSLTDLVNQTVGDALSDMLLVETVLLHRQCRSASVVSNACRS